MVLAGSAPHARQTPVGNPAAALLAARCSPRALRGRLHRGGRCRPHPAPRALPLHLLPLVREPLGARDDVRGAKRRRHAVRQGAQVHRTDEGRAIRADGRVRWCRWHEPSRGRGSGATRGELLGSTPKHAPQDGRVRVRWDFQPSTDPIASPGCSAVNLCLNVVARSFPTGIGQCRHPSQRSRQRNWEGAALGLDRWAVESGGRPKAYPRDTHGDDSVSSCKVPPPHRKLSDSELSRLSESATSAMDQVREWELRRVEEPVQQAGSSIPGCTHFVPRAGRTVAAAGIASRSSAHLARLVKVGARISRIR